MTGENRDELRWQQARALGLPTRRAIHQFVVDAGRPVGVAEIAAQFPVSTNTVRMHLAILRGAGLVHERVAPANGRGRPPLRYTAVAGALYGPNPYERLSRLLIEMNRSHQRAVDVGRAAALGDISDVAVGHEPVAALAAYLEDAGFEPRVVERRDGDADIVLGRCPFATVATTDPQTVCELHRGLAAGAAASIGGIDVDGLTVMNPHRAGCRMHVRRTR